MAEKKETTAAAETVEKKVTAKKTTVKKVEKTEKEVITPKTEGVEVVSKVEAKAPTKKVASKTEGVEVTPKSEIKSPTKKIALKTKGKALVKSGYQPRFKILFENEIKSNLHKEFNYKSVMAIPRIEKIVINMGVGAAVSDKKVADAATNDLTLLAAQKAMKTIARKSVSNFKLREGMAIGAKVTLRKNRMFDFLDKLISVAIPRVRDFRGVKATGFDGRGNFSFGVSEQIIFPEINYDKIDKVRGMDITIVTTAKTDQEAKSLLTHFGFPFRNK
ncbi:MAG: 50S ribosomal protein L5 [Spirochaetota bacterium]|nr:50S ribosomal protein L5 [Spirochaetota bacterium]